LIYSCALTTFTYTLHRFAINDLGVLF